MCSFIVFLIGLTSSVCVAILRFIWPRSQMRKENCINRWRSGHQLFSCIDQLLLFQTVRLENAKSKQDFLEVAEILDQMSGLLVASAAALKFTGDFAEGEYNKFAVADMEDYAPGSMSGLNMPDHSSLVLAFRKLALSEESRTNWPIKAQTSYARFASSLATAIDHHRHACRIMAGRRPPISKPTGATADKVLERMNQKRKADAGCPRRM